MISSKQPRKQRKALFNAPLHLRKKLLRVKLADELIKQLSNKIKRVTIKKGDKVKIVKGKFKSKIGKVLEVDYKKLCIYIEGIVRKNAKGVEKLISIKPYNVRIIEGDFTKRIKQ